MFAKTHEAKDMEWNLE